MGSKLEKLELMVLYDISRIIGQALNLDQTLETILEILSEYLSMNRGTITLQNPETGNLEIRASHGLTGLEKRRGVYRLDEGVTGLIFRTAEAFVVPDISDEPLFLNKTGARKIEKEGLSFIGVPIILNAAPIGVLSVDRLFEDNISFEEDIRFLTILGALVGQLVSLNAQVKAREENLIRANLSLMADVSEKCRNFFATGKSPAMLEVHNLIRKVSPTRATVLLLGESGTGKTLVARIIHELGDRSKGPFIKVNCAALPENLLESELFGYEKGAFTGASETKPGRVEEAGGGTIFLDEIGELPLTIQSKLLRFLQDKEFERLGSSKTRRVDVRIIAATNKDLETSVRDGLFRQDLYYRLNVFPIMVPPLNKRPEDIAPLVNFFSQKMSREYGFRLKLTPQAESVLLKYSWPGNVREMENLMERLAIIFGDRTIDLSELSPYVSNFARAQKDMTNSELESLEEVELRRVIAALDRHNWVQTRAARELGITLRQLGYRIKKYGLSDHCRRNGLTDFSILSACNDQAR
jgi:Nif-specific regulatory protein